MIVFVFSVELSVPGRLCGPREAEPGDSLPPPRLQGTEQSLTISKHFPMTGPCPDPGISKVGKRVT